MSMRVESSTNLYIRNKEGCDEIPAGERFKIYEFLGRKNGNSEDVSIALEEFGPKSSSKPHYHSKSEEYQVVLSGEGRLRVGNVVKIVKAGDLVKIPEGTVHQTSNDHENETLKLYCFVSPAWIYDDSHEVDSFPESEEKIEVYQRNKESCDGIKAGSKEIIHELLGKENGANDRLSIALVEIEEGGSTEAHSHDKNVESYIILEGQGRLTVDGQTREVIPGDVAKIPMGKVHKLFNDKKETLRFYCACTPAWTSDCMIKV